MRPSIVHANDAADFSLVPADNLHISVLQKKWLHSVAVVYVQNVFSGENFGEFFIDLYTLIE